MGNIEKLRLYPNRDVDIKFNDKDGWLGVRCVDTTNPKDMLRFDFKENIDFTYVEKALSILSWKINKKIVSSYAELPITTFCTLNCKHCTAYMPYITERRHLPLEELCVDADKYFNCIDSVGRFRILGGEPLTHPRLLDLISYIGDKYRNKIDQFCIVTNGTITPSEQLKVLIKKYNITLFISNYSQSKNPLTSSQRYAELFKMLDKEKIKYNYSIQQKWLDIGSPLTERKEENDAYLAHKFMDCRHFCRSILKNKLFICAAWAFAILGNVYKQDYKKFVDTEIIDLESSSLKDKNTRFLQWYKMDVEMAFPRGYLEFCKYCDGFGSENKKFVIAGEQ